MNRRQFLNLTAALASVATVPVSWAGNTAPEFAFTFDDPSTEGGANLTWPELYAVADRVATITLNRPDKLNAWSTTLEQEVRVAVEEAERDNQLRVIVLTGAGRGFCAGADMSLLGAVAKQGVSDQVWERALHNAGNEQNESVRTDFQKKYSYFSRQENL
jgi:hypothetical protein